MRPDVQIAAFYALAYGAFGVVLPYWPLWLTSRGLDADAVGLFLGAGTLAKIVATPLAGAVADRLGRRRAVLVALTFGSLVAYALYVPAQGPVLIIAIGFVAAACVAPLMALIDVLALGFAQQGALDYGRVRLFGSAGFMVVALAAGWLIEGQPADFLLWLTLAMIAVACLGALALPDDRSGDRHVLAPGLGAQLAATASLLRNRSFAWFLVAAGLIQNSHIALYGFSTIYWRDAGISSAMIGWLWAEGVIAEIVLFACAASLPAWLTPARLILLGGVGGAVRWAALGVTTDLAVVLPMQLLHALSFAAAHLGAMRYLVRTAPPGLAATAQALYVALPLGVGSGLAYAATGLLFGRFGGAAAFFAMSVSAAAGIVAMRQAERSGRHDSQSLTGQA